MHVFTRFIRRLAVKVYYSTGDHSERVCIDLYGLGSTTSIRRRAEQAPIAERCAEHDWNTKGAWATGASREIKLYASETGACLGTFVVDVELEPSFDAYYLREQQDKN